ncbi:MAG: hypothetical protein FWD43_03285, partial [Coriobacteriia bacterium]|nr:hypothetical protein [Coriobacteriia bacterium]
GYYANKYDVDMNTCFSRADNRITESILSAFSQTVKGYNSVSLNSQNTNLKNRNAKYALFPIWLLTTVWKDKEYIFAMNGQTGKLAGDLPLDKKAKHLWFWSILLGLGAVSTVLAGLSNYIVIATADDPLFDTVNQTLTTNDLIVWAVISLIGGSVIAYFVTGRMQRKLKTARMKKHASDYIQPGSFLISFSNEKFLGKNVSTSSKKSR